MVHAQISLPSQSHLTWLVYIGMLVQIHISYFSLPTFIQTFFLPLQTSNLWWINRHITFLQQHMDFFRATSRVLFFVQQAHCACSTLRAQQLWMVFEIWGVIEKANLLIRFKDNLICPCFVSTNPDGPQSQTSRHVLRYDLNNCGWCLKFEALLKKHIYLLGSRTT